MATHIILLTDSASDMQALFYITDSYGANPLWSDEDFACIFNLLYGRDNRFLSEGITQKSVEIYEKVWSRPMLEDSNALKTAVRRGITL